MKITIYIFQIIAIASIFIACENDLNTSPEDEFTAANYYKNASDLEGAVNAAYGGLQKNGLYAFNYHILMETRSDNTFEEEPNNSGGYGDVDLFNRVTNNSVFKTTWVDSYVTIQATNIVLNRIDGINDMDAETKKSRKGEMKFIRSLVYYNLVNLYGGVPLVLSETLNPTVYFGQGRTSVEDIYKQIITDLIAATSELPEKNGIGRATKGAANLLLGKVYLANNNPAAAETVLRAITGYTWINTYANLFGISNENNAASIFEVQFQSGINGTSEGSRFASKFSSQKNPGSKGNNIVTKDLIDSFETGDLRRSLIIPDPSDASINISTKYVDATREVVDDGDNNVIIFRYADVKLSLSEALNAQGYVADGEAFNLLNEIRNRAGLTNLTSATVRNQEEFKTALLKERRHEFFYENHRWFDLKRLGNPVKIMNEHFKNFVGKNVTIDDNDLLLPIPLDQINSDPEGIKQNLGY